MVKVTDHFLVVFDLLTLRLIFVVAAIDLLLEPFQITLQRIFFNLKLANYLITDESLSEVYKPLFKTLREVRIHEGLYPCSFDVQNSLTHL